MRTQTFPSLRTGTWRALLFLGVTALTPACDDDVIAPVPQGSAMTGTVTASATGAPVAGAEVGIGPIAVTTGTDGRFRLTGLTAGPATLRAIATGFEDFEADVTVPSSPTTRDVSLTRIERFEFGDFALYVPATVGAVRGILVALGGPDTRGFASDLPFGAPIPEVEASLESLGDGFQTLAAQHGLAVLGTSLAAMPDDPGSDRLLLDATHEGATLSGRPELGGAPLLLYGMSGGAPQASGFTARNAERVAALFLKVPAGLTSGVSDSDALGVPTYLVLAELDAFVDNAAIRAGFLANRGAGAPWALALESGVPHHSLTVAHRELTTHWMNEILALRLGENAPHELHNVEQSAGWLGDHSTGRAAPWSDRSDMGVTSWLPSRATAEEWEAFGAAGPSWGISLRIEPETLTVRMGSVEGLSATVLTETGGLVVQPAVTFTSSDEDVVTVGHDQLCLPGCRNWVYVLPVAPGETTVVALYAGVSDTARVTVLPAAATGG